MPSAFEAQMAAQLPGTLYGAFGLAAVYSDPKGTTGAACTIRVHRGDVRQVDRGNGTMGEVQSGEVFVMQAGAGAIAKPVKGGRFRVEGVEVWTIENTPVLKNGQFGCTCSRQGVDALMERRTKDA